MGDASCGEWVSGEEMPCQTAMVERRESSEPRRVSASVAGCARGCVASLRRSIARNTFGLYDAGGVPAGSSASERPRACSAAVGMPKLSLQLKLKFGRLGSV